MILEDVSTISTNSKTKVMRRCDNCESEDMIQYRSLYLSRNRRNSEKDYCVKCTKQLSSINNRRGCVYDSNGYSYFQMGKERLFIHTKIVEEALDRKLTETEVVHHVDGDKKNNNIDNLHVFENQKRHMLSHSSIQSLAFELVKSGKIKFDVDTEKYYLNRSNDDFERSFGFEEIAIKQKKNICQSRLDTELKSEFVRGVFIDVPLVAANMSTVVDSSFYIKLYKARCYWCAS